MIALTVQMIELHCGTCGILFAVPHSVYLDREEAEEEITCPSGHGEVYTTVQTGKPAEESPKVQELRRELVAALHRAEQSEARATDTRKKKTK